MNRKSMNSLTRTLQPRSLAYLSKPEKDLTVNKLETDDNMSLLLSVYDSLNTLCDRLNRLNHVIQRKNLEILNCEYKEGVK